jgi:hypothetical protein
VLDESIDSRERDIPPARWQDEIKSAAHEVREHQAAKAAEDASKLRVKEEFDTASQKLDDVVFPTLIEVAEVLRGEDAVSSVMDDSPLPQHHRSVVLRLGGAGSEMSDLVFEANYFSSHVEVRRVTARNEAVALCNMDIGSITPASVAQYAILHFREFVKGA